MARVTTRPRGGLLRYDSAMRLTFWGGAGKVTGSNFLIETSTVKLLVDCGIAQGRDYSEDAVYGPFGYEPATIDALVVTHAHLDHVGRIPRLVKDGFRGKIFMTPPTRDLAELILRDSIDILHAEATRRGLPPLYDERDVALTLSLCESVGYHEEQKVGDLSFFLRNTGHILGSASVRIQEGDGTSLAITGDIGNSPSPLLPDWEAITDADVLVMESVYGNRAHPHADMRVSELRDVLKRAIARQGAILIPAFSMERTQLMLYELSNFFSERSLPPIPVYLDSPLAIAVTDVYEKWGRAYFKKEAEQEMRREKSLFTFPFLRKTKSREESQEIAKTPNPKIIIAGAGMSHGGRIGAHEIRYLPDPKTTLLIVGYQAPGSPGRLLEDGVKSVRLQGKEVAVRAHVESMLGWSAHADRDELVRFAEAASKRAKTIFAAIGEPSAERFLAQRIHDYIGVKAIVPELGQSWEITKKGATLLS